METKVFVPYVAPAAPPPMPIYDPRANYCPRCGTVGFPQSDTPGSFMIELVLWLFFLLPGLIYSIWRLTSKSQVCPGCRQPGMIPVQSPIAQRALYG